MKNKESFYQMIKFFLFSCSAGMIQTLTFALFDTVLHLEYWPSYLMALTLSVIWNFTLNRKYTFKSAVNVPKAMLMVFLYYLVFTPISTWLGQLWADNGGNHYLILFTNMIANLVTEFLFDKYFVFREKQKKNII